MTVGQKILTSDKSLLTGDKHLWLKFIFRSRPVEQILLFQPAVVGSECSHHYRPTQHQIVLILCLYAVLSKCFVAGSIQCNKESTMNVMLLAPMIQMMEWIRELTLQYMLKN